MARDEPHDSFDHDRAESCLHDVLGSRLVLDALHELEDR
jgi:hypothetical protein